MLPGRYLLYLDILGFSEMAQTLRPAGCSHQLRGIIISIYQPPFRLASVKRIIQSLPKEFLVLGN